MAVYSKRSEVDSIDSNRECRNIMKLLHVNLWLHLGVSKNRGTPKWLIFIMENPFKMDDLGGPLGYPYFWKHPFGSFWSKL